MELGFQIGGGAGDFPICVVPMLYQDMKCMMSFRVFCQISDSTTSYGSYSGAVLMRRLLGKIGHYNPKFIIESDATIVAPLILLPTRFINYL